MNIFTKSEKYAIINILLCIMKSDGIIHPKEEEFMNAVYNDFAITISDLESVLNIDFIQANNIIQGMSDEKKMLVLPLFIGIAKADNFIHPKEIEIINQIFDV